MDAKVPFLTFKYKTNLDTFRIVQTEPFCSPTPSPKANLHIWWKNTHPSHG